MINANVPQADSDPKNLIVNYIPTPVTDDELRKLFSPFGTVESARIILDRATNHPKGYGFVKYTTEDAAKRAMRNMNGFEIGNKRLRVTQATGPQNRTIENYAGRVVQLQQPAAPQPSVSQAVPMQYITQQYTMMGPGAPMYPTANLPTVMLAPQAGMPYYQQQAPNNAYFVEINGEPMQLVSPGPLPVMQQYGIVPMQMQQQQQQQQQQQVQQVQMQQQAQAQGQEQGMVQPLRFSPFRPGSPHSDPIMHSSFLLSVAQNTPSNFMSSQTPENGTAFSSNGTLH